MLLSTSLKCTRVCQSYLRNRQCRNLHTVQPFPRERDCCRYMGGEYVKHCFRGTTQIGQTFVDWQLHCGFVFVLSDPSVYRSKSTSVYFSVYNPDPTTNGHAFTPQYRTTYTRLLIIAASISKSGIVHMFHEARKYMG